MKAATAMAKRAEQRRENKGMGRGQNEKAKVEQGRESKGMRRGWSEKVRVEQGCKKRAEKV